MRPAEIGVEPSFVKSIGHGWLGLVQLEQLGLHDFHGHGLHSVNSSKNHEGGLDWRRDEMRRNELKTCSTPPHHFLSELDSKTASGSCTALS